MLVSEWCTTSTLNCAQQSEGVAAVIVGMDKDGLDTPALWVDLDVMEGNITRIAGYLKEAGVAWRPHIKGIKIPAIVHALLDAGAIGVTCAKLGEAEVMAASGVKDILIANQIVGRTKITRLVNLCRHVDVMVSVDCIDNAREISEIASASDSHVRAVIEVNIGMNRCGVEPGRPVVDLALEMAKLTSVELVGVTAWEGSRIVHIKDPDEKKKQCELVVGRLVESARMCRAQGLQMPIVSCGGTGTYTITSHVPGVTEIQAGGGVFSAVAYRDWGVNLDYALFVLASVVSRPSATRAIVDAGQKTMNGGLAMPIVRHLPGVRLVALHSEHGLLELENAEVDIHVNDKLDFVVGYGDYTINLHDQVYGVRKGSVEAVWDNWARGKQV
jgi:D-serine deaminase-like pyridoxal phosphate-dependent protein